MPIPIGKFISHNVYDNQLRSEHKIQALSSCVFVNVAKGKEERKGHSWMVRLYRVSFDQELRYPGDRMLVKPRLPWI